MLALVVKGMLNKQIAGALGAAEKTIKIHRRPGHGQDGRGLGGRAGPDDAYTVGFAPTLESIQSAHALPAGPTSYRPTASSRAVCRVTLRVTSFSRRQGAASTGSERCLTLPESKQLSSEAEVSTGALPAAPAASRHGLIPGGTFEMGSNDHYPEERPVHRVTVDGFWIDRCPVTNERFVAS